MQLIAGHDLKYLPIVRTLFREYADAIEVDLCFQDFDRELAELPGKYAPPTGRLIVAFEGSEPAGCIALRAIGDGICEMKRLYVRPPFRRQGLGRKLAHATLAAAREEKYELMRLDTLASMHDAIALYESLGFQQIPAYCHNPEDNAVFMELKLRPEISRQP